MDPMYSGDYVGGVNMDDHVDNSEFDPGFGALASGRFTSNHAAFVLILIAVLGLWIIQRVFKGA